MPKAASTTKKDHIEDAWVLESAKDLKDHMIKEGEEFEEFFGVHKERFIQVARRMPSQELYQLIIESDFDQPPGQKAKLVWPAHACGAFAIKDGTIGLGCIRVSSFDTDTQEMILKGKLLVQWLYTPDEAIERLEAKLSSLNKRQRQRFLALKRKLEAMDGDTNLLLSNVMSIESNGALHGPAIEPEQDDSKIIAHYLDLTKWERYTIDPMPLRDLVRPVKWDSEGETFGDVMDEAEFFEKYGHHAAPGGLLPEDIHPSWGKPDLILVDFGNKDYLDDLREERTTLKDEAAKVEEEMESIYAEMALLDAAQINLQGQDDDNDEDNDDEESEEEEDEEMQEKDDQDELDDEDI
ncbi:hypothetical protein FRB90_008357 [Tulasnella sp. 427]|nr:hypothetical protein FRB90_008357 [Tulasnella sp. 427]